MIPTRFLRAIRVTGIVLLWAVLGVEYIEAFHPGDRQLVSKWSKSMVATHVHRLVACSPCAVLVVSVDIVQDKSPLTDRVGLL